MNVQDVMNKEVFTVSMDDSLERVQALFNKFHFHHVLVMDQQTLVGVVSDRDFLKALSPNLNTFSENRADRMTLEKKVHQVMSRNPFTADPEMDVGEAAKFMLDKGISCLPVLSKNNHVVGILTLHGITRKLISILKKEG